MSPLGRDILHRPLLRPLRRGAQLARSVLSWWRSEPPLSRTWTEKRRRLIAHHSPQSIINFETSSAIVAPTYRCNMDCRYCYRRSMEELFPRDMTLDDFQRCLDWLSRRGSRLIRLQGGEPTVHPQFPQLLHLARAQGIDVLVCTNGVYGEEVREHMIPDLVRVVWLNFSAWASASPPLRERFMVNAESLRALGVPLILAYVMEDSDAREEELLAMARHLSTPFVRACFPVPGYDRSVSVQDFTAQLRPMALRYLRLARRGGAQGTYIFSYRTIPRCALLDGEILQLQAIHPHLVYSRCIIGFNDDWGFRSVINPDLTTFPCAACFVRGPSILSISDPRALSDYFRPRVRPLLHQPLMAPCQRCDYHQALLKEKPTRNPESFFSLDVCQGGCLSFHQ